MGVDDGHLVVADAVDVILLRARQRVVDQELADVLVPVGEDEAANPALIGEIQAAIVVAGRLAVEEEQARVVESTAGMIEDEVKEHAESVEVQNVDDAFELVRPGQQLLTCNRRFAVRRQKRAGFGDVAAEIALGDGVAHLGRIQVEAVVAHALFAREFLDRHQLDRVDPEVSQVFDAIQKVQKFRDAGALIVPVIVDRVVDADMQLIKDQIAEFRGAESLIVPRERVRGAHHAIRRGKVAGQLPRAWTAFEPGTSRALDPEHIARAFSGAGQDSAERAVSQRRERRRGRRYESGFARVLERAARENENVSRGGRPGSDGYRAWNDGGTERSVKIR